MVSSGSGQCGVSMTLSPSLPVLQGSWGSSWTKEGGPLLENKPRTEEQVQLVHFKNTVLQNHQLSTASTLTLLQVSSNLLSVELSNDPFNSHTVSETSPTPGAERGDRSETLMSNF